MKRNYARLSLRDALELLQRDVLMPWHLAAPPRPPSADLQAHLQRLASFDLTATEAAKTLLIDALLAEIVPQHPKLKVWKAALLQTDTLTGMADYLIAPHRAYLATPLLCVTEAKRDDFERGRVQCLGELYACAWNNGRAGHDLDVFGIVSNGQGWQFYKLTRAGDPYETGLYTAEYLPELLGALDAICAECARAVP